MASRTVTIEREELNGVHEFVLRIDGERFGFLEFTRPDVGVMRIEYVEVSPESARHGARASSWSRRPWRSRRTRARVVPICSYARAVIQRDPAMSAIATSLPPAELELVTSVPLMRPRVFSIGRVPRAHSRLRSPASDLAPELCNRRHGCPPRSAIDDCCRRHLAAADLPMMSGGTARFGAMAPDRAAVLDTVDGTQLRLGYILPIVIFTTWSAVIHGIAVIDVCRHLRLTPVHTARVAHVRRAAMLPGDREVVHDDGTHGLTVK